MGSSRLPGKVLLKAADEPVLSHVIRRVSAARGVDRVVVATTSEARDDCLEELAGLCGASVTRGSEDDVLGRYVQAFDEWGGEVGIRITADCPLQDPELIAQGLTAYRTAAPPVDYLSNTVERSYPRGYDLEIFSVSALRRAGEEASSAAEREHVTPFFYWHPELFRIGTLKRRDPLKSSEWRLTLDTPDDWRVLGTIIESLAPRDALFGLADVEAFLLQRPYILQWNQHVQQKPVA